MRLGCSSDVAQYLNLSLPECRSIIDRFNAEQERETQKIREKLVDQYSRTNAFYYNIVNSSLLPLYFRFFPLLFFPLLCVPFVPSSSSLFSTLHSVPSVILSVFCPSPQVRRTQESNCAAYGISESPLIVLRQHSSRFELDNTISGIVLQRYCNAIERTHDMHIARSSPVSVIESIRISCYLFR